MAFPKNGVKYCSAGTVLLNLLKLSTNIYGMFVLNKDFTEKRLVLYLVISFSLNLFFSRHHFFHNPERNF